MRLNPDSRLPISNDVSALKTRLNDIFRSIAIAVNGIDTTGTGTGTGTTVYQGNTTVDFGSASTDTTRTISGQTEILSTSVINVSFKPSSSVSNTADNHWVEDMEVTAGNIVAGTGFTIYAKANRGKAHGVYNVSWSYS